VSWLFQPLDSSPTYGSIIKSWEKRRLAYNFILGSAALVFLPVFVWALSSSGHLRPGEDAVEPLSLLAAPVLANMGYTLGWIAEILCRHAGITTRHSLGPRLLRLGLAFSLFIVALPALIWVSVRLCGDAAGE
jgi:hypothetical protein